MSVRDIKPNVRNINTGTSDSILASVFNGILNDLNITNTPKYDQLLDRYITNHPLMGATEKFSSLRGNIEKELKNTAISWKVFIKGMVFLEVENFEFTVWLKHANKITTVHSISVELTKNTLETKDTDSVLSNLYKNILLELNIHPQLFITLLNNYIVTAGIPTNSHKSSSLRGNIKKELLADVMSWKVFVKGLVLLNIKQFDIRTKLTFKKGKPSEHVKTVILDFSNSFEDEI